MSTAYHQQRYGGASYRYPAPMKTRPSLPARMAPEPDDDTTYDDNSKWNLLPAWEKRFCEEVGGMPWRRFVEAKKKLSPQSQNDKVFAWNDSAGKQAFEDAKKRFRAEYHYHGLSSPQKKRLPNATMYIFDKHIDLKPETHANTTSDEDEEGGGFVLVKEADWFSILLMD